MSSRRSSLISISSNGSSTMATSVTSGMSRSPSSAYPQSPDLIPPIDPIAIVEIENQARLVADSLDLMMGNLRGNLHNVSLTSCNRATCADPGIFVKGVQVRGPENGLDNVVFFFQSSTHFTVYRGGPRVLLHRKL